jgi:DNA mismatch endonuclease, patch repair protein
MNSLARAIARKVRKRRTGLKLTKSEQMALVRSKDTTPELVFRQALWEAGLRYRIRRTLPGTPDIVFVNCRVAVFVDGCFWHGCRRHYTAPARNSDFWRQKLFRNVERDRRVDRELRRMGWRIARLWEHDISENVEAAVERVRRFVSPGAARPWRRSTPCTRLGNVST